MNMSEQFMDGPGEQTDPRAPANARASGGGNCKTKKKPKRPAEWGAMRHHRALALLSPDERRVLDGCFDEDGQLLPGMEENEQKQAILVRFADILDEIGAWERSRCKGGALTFGIPLFILLQPDLSRLEKQLLSDVWHLQRMPGRCFKSNWGFALDLGVAEQVVANELCMLRKAGFLPSSLDEKGRRLLRLSDWMHALDQTVDDGQAPSSETDPDSPRATKKGSPENDGGIIGKLCADHRKMIARSLSDDGGRVPDTGKTRVNTGAAGPPPAAEVQGREIEKKTTTTRQDGVVVDSDFGKTAQSLSHSSPKANPARRASNPQDVKSSPAAEADKFLQACQLYLGSELVESAGDRKAAEEFFQQPERSALKTVYVMCKSQRQAVLPFLRDFEEIRSAVDEASLGAAAGFDWLCAAFPGQRTTTESLFAVDVEHARKFRVRVFGLMWQDSYQQLFGRQAVLSAEDLAAVERGLETVSDLRSENILTAAVWTLWKSREPRPYDTTFDPCFYCRKAKNPLLFFKYYLTFRR